MNRPSVAASRPGFPLCRACGSSNTVLRGRKPGTFIRRDFEFYQCRECELMFVEPFSGFEIYNDEYYRGHGPDPYVDYETEYRDWRASDRGFEFDDMARIAGDFVQKGCEQRVASSGHPATGSSTRDSKLRWLDFGCGAGGFLKYLRERGSIGGRPIELTGHDVGSYAELLKTKDGFRILDWEEVAREPAEGFDVISMIEVIEHLPSPLEPLTQIARLLKPGGLLLLTTGNLDSPIARRQGIAYRYCAPEIHVSLYNPRCLDRLYRRIGLEPILVRYDGAVKFKVVKSLRHHPILRGVALAGMALPGIVRAIDTVYGVSAMPCAVKPLRPANAGARDSQTLARTS